jgi:hypothetical protein
MIGPPKKERGLFETAFRKTELLIAYRLLRLLQAPFGFVFWLIERAIARIDMEIERRAS